MKKIKFLVMALAAMMLSAGFTSCSDNDDDTLSNMERYQQEVENTVRAEKAHKKALLLVAFGSTWQQAYDAFDLTRQEYQKAFPDYDVFLSFSSAICINRAAAGENTAKRSFYEPKYWLEAFGRVQYEEIIVQSMQVIPGEEFSRVVNAMKDFGNNVFGDLDDAYMKTVTLKLGMPLMYTEDDAKELASALDANFHKYAEMGAMLFMGHGNPDDYDTYKANVRYTQLEEALQKYNKNYFVGTVDMPENYKQDVLARMQEAGITSGKMNLYPLMSICGDHGHNDMAGQGSDYWDAEDEESEDNSWFEYFSHKGYAPQSNLIGLLEVESLRNLWIEHTKHPVELEDYYHSMYPEE